MKQKISFKEALKEYMQLYNYKNDETSEEYKYYNPKDFTTKPQKIYERLEKIEKEKKLDRRRKDIMMDSFSHFKI